jgi:transcriptional regulator with XRE-family HTH domain
MEGEMSKEGNDPDSVTTLGEHLAALRRAAQLTLRQVEDATDKEVSNAYLSQLENNKITKPSPNILHALAAVYKASYEGLMEKAGYLTPGQARPATFAISELTTEEEHALIAYLEFFRKQKKK